jgi:hypothetical protein
MAFVRTSVSFPTIMGFKKSSCILICFISRFFVVANKQIKYLHCDLQVPRIWNRKEMKTMQVFTKMPLANIHIPSTTSRTPFLHTDDLSLSYEWWHASRLYRKRVNLDKCVIEKINSRSIAYAHINGELNVDGDAERICKGQRSTGILEVFADILQTKQRISLIFL